MSDHAVGGVDHLVDGAPRKAANNQPECWRHDGVGKVLGKTFDGSAGDTGGVEAIGIASHNV